MNKRERMQLKAFICVLGILLIIVLLLARLLLFFLHKEQEEPHVPVIQEFQNVWLIGESEDKLFIFREGMEESYPHAMEGIVAEQLADIVVTNGIVTEIHVKGDKINGKVLSVDAQGVEIEGYGRLPLAEDYKGYRIYKSLAMCQASDLSVGYQFADFVLEDNQICGILIVREEAMEHIRVLLKTSDFSGLFHDRVVLTADTDFTIQYGDYTNRQIEEYQAGEELVIDKDSSYFQGDRVLIVPDALTGKVLLKSVNRSQGTPGYRGLLELHIVEEGIIVVNELLLEEYLYCVVPSEMPASYPDEALQAQAVCARTYAYGHMQRAGYPQYGAHVDDSTSYQVYNNILEQASTTAAVKETYGQILYTPEGGLVGAYYYSTSCGVGTDATVWKTSEAQGLTYLKGRGINRTELEAVLHSANAPQTDGINEVEVVPDLGELLKEEAAFADFISQTNTDDFEVPEGWYRWSYEVLEIDKERMLGLLQKRYQANNSLVLTWKDGEYISAPIEELKQLSAMYIEKRGRGGIADELIIETGEHTYKVISEYNIRYVLNNGESKVIRQDGSEVAAATLLPSAFFVLKPHVDADAVVGYTLSGGGFGHGVGMSQNAAKNMADSGYTSDNILTFFYEGCSVKNVYDDMN